MSTYVLRRIAQSILVIFILSFVVYVLLGLMPGDPVDLMIQSNPKITTEDIARIKSLYGLDKPIYVRYWHWLTDVMKGDFGYSRIYKKPVTELIFPRLWNTVKLSGLAFILSILIAVPIGIYSALRPYTKADYGINMIAFAGISIPSFWLALMLITVFSVHLGWLPAGGMMTIGVNSPFDQLQYLILPVISLCAQSTGSLTRFTRSSMMETMRFDYIRTAKAKGLGMNKVVLKHALRNALIPVVTVIAISFGYLFSGALVTETVFNYQGMGKFIYDSIMGNDYNSAMIALLFSTFMVLACNLLADICYAWLDPRISYS